MFKFASSVPLGKQAAAGHWQARAWLQPPRPRSLATGTSSSFTPGRACDSESETPASGWLWTPGRVVTQESSQAESLALTAAPPPWRRPSWHPGRGSQAGWAGRGAATGAGRGHSGQTSESDLGIARLWPPRLAATRAVTGQAG